MTIKIIDFKSEHARTMISDGNVRRKKGPYKTWLGLYKTLVQKSIPKIHSKNGPFQKGPFQKSIPKWTIPRTIPRTIPKMDHSENQTTVAVCKLISQAKSGTVSRCMQIFSTTTVKLEVTENINRATDFQQTNSLE